MINSAYRTRQREMVNLAEFSLKNRLEWLNTKFHKRKGMQWTDTFTNKFKAHLDYIFINKNWINSI